VKRGSPDGCRERTDEEVATQQSKRRRLKEVATKPAQPAFNMPPPVSVIDTVASNVRHAILHTQTPVQDVLPARAGAQALVQDGAQRAVLAAAARVL
jgi:hypothetical protein